MATTRPTSTTSGATATSTAKPAAGSTASKPKAAPAAVVKPKPKPAAKPKAPVQRQYVTIKGADGKDRRVLMEVNKIAAMKRAKAIADTTPLIPDVYRGMVDPAQIDAAVTARIAGLNAPSALSEQNAIAQHNANVLGSQSLERQTQGALDQLVANSQVGARDLAALAIQRDAARGVAQQAATGAAASVLGTELNPLVAGMVDAKVDPLRAAGAAQQVQQTTTDRLMQQGQTDFFQRGKGLAAITQQSFTEGQRQQLAAFMRQVAATQAANNAQRPDMVRSMAAEDAAFASAQAKQQSEDALAAQAFGLDVKKLQLDSAKAKAANEVARKNAETAANAVTQRDQANIRTTETSRANAVDRNAAAARKAAQTELAKVNAAQKKALASVHAEVQKRYNKVGQPVPGTKAQKEYEAADLFPGTGGPWREAFAQLTSPEVGLNANQAALYATAWYKQSIQGHDYAKIKALLDNRGVSGVIFNQIMHMVDPASKPLQGPNLQAGIKPKPAHHKKPKYHPAQGTGQHAPPSLNIIPGIPGI